jgi:hypothetical protein
MVHYFTSGKKAFGGKSLYEVCQRGEEGQKEVINFFGRLEHGVFQ